MGQITEQFAADMLGRAERGLHPQFTVWEAKQLLLAWQEREALRKDAERYRFEREHRFQWFEPTRHWRLFTALDKTVHEGVADTYDDAVDAAMRATAHSATA
jgi:hypothetical protein